MKKFISLFIIVCLLANVSILPVCADLPQNCPSNETVSITSAAELHKYCKHPNGKTAVLNADITADENSFVLSRKTNAELDLHGHTIYGIEGVDVITLDGGNLTLIDSSGVNAGKITHLNNEGRAIYVDEYGSFLMKGGNITQNRRTEGFDAFANGGGICAHRGNVTITGGIVMENVAVAGGGLYTYMKRLGNPAFYTENSMFIKSNMFGEKTSKDNSNQDLKLQITDDEKALIIAVVLIPVAIIFLKYVLPLILKFFGLTWYNLHQALHKKSLYQNTLGHIRITLLIFQGRAKIQ